MLFSMMLAVSVVGWVGQDWSDGAYYGLLVGLYAVLFFTFDCTKADREEMRGKWYWAVVNVIISLVMGWGCVTLYNKPDFLPQLDAEGVFVICLGLWLAWEGGKELFRRRPTAPYNIEGDLRLAAGKGERERVQDESQDNSSSVVGESVSEGSRVDVESSADRKPNCFARHLPGWIECQECSVEVQCATQTTINRRRERGERLARR